jgi:hypothetical protein
MNATVFMRPKYGCVRRSAHFIVSLHLWVTPWKICAAGR